MKLQELLEDIDSNISNQDVMKLIVNLRNDQLAKIYGYLARFRSNSVYFCRSFDRVVPEFSEKNRKLMFDNPLVLLLALLKRFDIEFPDVPHLSQVDDQYEKAQKTIKIYWVLFFLLDMMIHLSIFIQRTEMIGHMEVIYKDLMEILKKEEYLKIKIDHSFFDLYFENFDKDFLTRYFFLNEPPTKEKLEELDKLNELFLTCLLYDNEKIKNKSEKLSNTVMNNLKESKFVTPQPDIDFNYNWQSCSIIVETNNENLKSIDEDDYAFAIKFESELNDLTLPFKPSFTARDVKEPNPNECDCGKIECSGCFNVCPNCKSKKCQNICKLEKVFKVGNFFKQREETDIKSFNEKPIPNIICQKNRKHFKKQMAKGSQVVAIKTQPGTSGAQHNQQQMESTVASSSGNFPRDFKFHKPNDNV